MFFLIQTNWFVYKPEKKQIRRLQKQKKQKTKQYRFRQFRQAMQQKITVKARVNEGIAIAIIILELEKF